MCLLGYNYTSKKKKTKANDTIKIEKLAIWLFCSANIYCILCITKNKNTMFCQATKVTKVSFASLGSFAKDLVSISSKTLKYKSICTR